ncbi:MAG TPA: hypothetical protein ENN07_00865 [candidate division Zixibacteria bacterium]|nr:hypothetical protein [candidate division Zixibacteria bacterium]
MRVTKFLIYFLIFASASALFSADTIPPVVRLVWPDTAAYVSCEFPVIEMTITDDFFIDRSSILLTLFRPPDVHAVPESMASVIDSFYYFPIRIPMFNGDSVSLLMHPVSDYMGNESPSFWFHFFVDRKGPDITALFPAPESEVANPRPPISATITDVAGVARDSCRITIDGAEYPLTGPYATWSGDRFTFRTDLAGLFFRGGDTVDVCVHAEDLAEGCGFNESDTCWRFWIPSGGPVADVIFPPVSKWMSCPDSGAFFRIEDDDGVEPESIWVVFAGDTMRYGDVRLSWSPPILRMEITSFRNSWFDGELHACDVLGNPIDPPLAFEFGIDTEPPYVFNEFPMGATNDLNPIVSFELADESAGMMHSATMAGVSVEGSPIVWFSLSDERFSFDGSVYTLDSLAIPPLRGGDTVTIHIMAYDSIEVCPVNQLNANWFFYIPATPPTAELILPERGTVSSCARQGVWFSIEDEDGIIPSSIRLNVGGTTIGVDSPQLSLDGAMLRFEPSADWHHGAHITGAITAVLDSLLNTLSAPVPFDFFIDLEPPRVLSTSPSNFALVNDTLRDVRLRIEDSPAGVDPASIEVTVKGAPFTVDDDILQWSPPYLTFSPDSTCSWDIVDTVEFCLVSIADLPDTCPPNEAEPFCFTFFVDGRDPFADPPDGAIVACPEQEVRIYLWAPGGGVLPETIEFEINGLFLTVDSASVFWDGETLLYVPSEPWADGDSVLCHLLRAEGHFGGIPEVRWGFLMDYSPPVLSNISPSPGDVVARLNPPIEFTLVDSISGLLEGAFRLTVDGNAFGIEHPAISRAGDEFSFAPNLGGMHIAGGDTVVVCIHAEDWADPDYCGPNSLDTCWSFSIEAGGPVADLISPPEMTPYACDSVIILSISDPNGVDWTTLRLSVRGEVLEFDDSRLDISGDSVTIWANPASGETVTVELIHVEDSLANPAERHIWRVVFDFDPPEIRLLYPSPDTTLTTSTPELAFLVRDAVSAWHYDVYPPALIDERGDTVFISPAATRDYDTLLYCVSACDSAICPNCDTACVSIFIDTAPPTAELVVPPEGARTACDPQRVVIRVFDPSGISATGLVAFFGTDTVGLSDSRLRLVEDSLIFEPTEAFPAGEVHVGIILLEDRWGNVLRDFSAMFYSVGAPVFLSVSPAPATSCSTIGPPISATLDSADTAWFEIDGTAFSFGTAGFTFDGTDIALSTETAGLSWSAGDTVEVCAYSGNLAELCGPAVAETCWNFYILYSPPVCDILSTECGRFSACPYQGIDFSIIDEEGVDEFSIDVSVNGEHYSIADSELSFDAASGVLSFVPFSEWGEDSLVFCLHRVSDALGAEADDLPLCCTIYMDFLPPDISVTPPGGSYLPIPVDTFVFTVRDFGAGGTLDSVSVNSVWVSIDDDELEYSDSIGLFNLWPIIADDPPESLTVCASASDLVEFCGPNDTTICSSYGLNITAPVIEMIFPENASVTSCADGPLLFTATDPDGIDTNSIVLIINDNTIDAPDSRFSFSRDTITFSPDTAWRHNSIIYGSLTVADPLGSTSLPYDFSFTIDIEPPIIIFAHPTIEVLDTFTDIIIVIEDAPAGISYASPIVLINSDTATYTWRGDTIAIDRTPFGFCEFDTVRVEIVNLSDLAAGCGANVLPDTVWSFIILDDDTLPPILVSYSPQYARLGVPFTITAFLEDESGIFEAWLLWSRDSFADPETLDMFEIEPGVWSASEVIDVSDAERITVRICATDNDFDCGNPLDRSTACNDFYIPLLPIQLDPIYTHNSPWDPQDMFADPLCAGERYIASIIFENRETLDVFVDIVQIYGDSVVNILPWADSLISPAETLFLPIQLFAENHGIYSDTIIIYDSRLGYPVAFDTVWANLVICEFRAFPNPFSPNDDGFYDEFKIELPRGGDVEISFYRLEGTRVATLRGDGRKYAWNGTDDRGRPQPPGIYLYVIRVDGNVYRHGSVTLAR